LLQFSGDEPVAQSLREQMARRHYLTVFSMIAGSGRGRQGKTYR